MWFNFFFFMLLLLLPMITVVSLNAGLAYSQKS